jgi:hypothetical protein
MRYFISHESFAKVQAIDLREQLTKLNPEHQIFLTSDWESIQSGGIWMADIIEALQKCDEIIVLLTRKEAFDNLWISFEVGAAIGRKIKPIIVISSGVHLNDMKFPLKGLHCIEMGDTNRWVKEFGRLGYTITDHTPFSKLFVPDDKKP